MDTLGLSWPESNTEPWDPPLTQQGREQIRTSMKPLINLNFERLIASPMRRTVESADIAATALGIPFDVDAGLVEWQNSEWFEGPTLGNSKWYRGSSRWRGGTVQRSAPVFYPETEGEAKLRCLRAARYWLDRVNGNLLLMGHENGVVGIANGLFGWDIDHVAVGTLLHQSLLPGPAKSV